ncbi:EF-P 5-aminopentanol modification-associated protein YfmF [Geomicrobium sediminis]|uniref:Zn-dependent peptidase n=1 Tax=Geomicrobium sediminis TaxID=1347788 RepID=A0ABS2PB72_9BACL|nr:pitrilysin family protein [Geomicrobium sediminis]MBM7632649.1 putative Zn-dependent peptidase [Geomicrobium sediminis]
MAEVETFQVGSMNVHFQPSKKYKTTTFVLQIKAPLEKGSAAARALLMQVLQAGTNNFPSRRAIRKHLDSLYGASFGGDVSKKGEQHFLTFFMEVPHEKFLQQEDEPLVKKALTFLTSALLEPVRENGTFKESIVYEEKQALKSKIKNIADDKVRYANGRLIEEMCKDETYGIHPYGSYDEVEALTTQDLEQAYESLLENDQFDLFITGPGKVDELTPVLNERKASFKSRAVKTSTTVNGSTNNGREVIEHQDLQQAKLHLGFRVPYTASDAEYATVLVANGIFGAFPHSKLFVNVREKESLAYYAASRYEPYKGLIFAMAGIGFEQFEKATKIMTEQLDALKAGDFTEDELTTTKLMIKNQILEQVDTARGNIDLMYQNVLTGRERSVEERVNEIDAVTREDVERVSKAIELDTVYLLTGKEERA